MVYILTHLISDMSMKGSISMVNPSSPPIPRSCNVSSSLIWTPPSVSSGINTSSSTGDSQYRPQMTFFGDPHLQKERHPQPESLRHPFQQHAYTIVDPQQQHSTPQSQGNTISQSMFNQMYNSQTRNAKMPFSQGLEFGGKLSLNWNKLNTMSLIK